MWSNEGSSYVVEESILFYFLTSMLVIIMHRWQKENWDLKFYWSKQTSRAVLKPQAYGPLDKGPDEMFSTFRTSIDAYK